MKSVPNGGFQRSGIAQPYLESNRNLKSKRSCYFDDFLWYLYTDFFSVSINELINGRDISRIYCETIMNKLKLSMVLKFIVSYNNRIMLNS